MVITLDVFVFQINLFSLVAFFTGILTGVIILTLIYVFVCLSSLNKKSVMVNKLIENITEEDIKKTISKYQEAYTDEKKRRKSVSLGYFRDSVLEMIKEIAGQFYPDSKRPLAELTIDELILLDRYIINKVEELLNHRGLSLLRRLKLSTILSIVDTTSKVSNTKVVKTIKENKLDKIASACTTVLTALNPVTWVKKLVINPAIDHIVYRILLICYSVVGEETYNVYSKQALVYTDESLKKLLEEIDKEGENLSPEDIVREEEK